MSLQGKLLVAAPSLNEGPFARTVVLILQHSDDGCFGVVLNRPADNQMHQIWAKQTGVPAIGQDRFCLGGPVKGPVLALHQSEPLSEIVIADNVFLSLEARKLTQLYRQSPDQLRIFVGISTWQIGQLESELNRGIWFLLSADTDDIFGDSDLLWESCLRSYGQQVWQDLLRIDHLPSQPDLN